MQYWYNIRTRQVEEDAVKSRENDLMGPYATREEAQQALARARQNTEQWDEEDRRWAGGGDEDLED